jgi:VIT1/CCC1 family predicted Fe2+/Mn2+ transporter
MAMSEPTLSSRRVLDPIERVSEILFGLIMVLTFTGSLSVADIGRDAVRTMLIAALGCNLAWGLIDGILYLMACLADRAHALMTLRAVRATADPGRARQVIAKALPAPVASILQPAELDAIHERLRRLPAPSAPARLRKDDWLGALAVFLLVFGSTFPVVIPFLVMRDGVRALRASNAIAVVMLFVTGWVYGRAVGRRPWAVGGSMVVLGLLLVGLTIALGG